MLRQMCPFTTMATLLFLGSMLTASANGDPVIGSVDGRLNKGASVTIGGSGFGLKDPARPLLWADFEQGNLNPVAPGVRTSWDYIENMVWSRECVSGSGCAKGTAAGSPWTLGIILNYVTIETQTTYYYKKHKMNFLITSSTQNWKSFRMWAPDNRPNFFLAPSHGAAHTEGCLDPASDGAQCWSNIQSGIRVPHTNWYVEEFLVKGSTLNTNDGRFVAYYDGATVMDVPMCYKCTAASTHMNEVYPVHDVAAWQDQGIWNPPWSPDNRVWADDIYVDTTWARVMICAGSTWSSRGHCEIQIPTAWTDSSISVQINQGSLSASGNYYLYVVNSENRANTNGFRLTQTFAPTDSIPPSRPLNVHLQ